GGDDAGLPGPRRLAGIRPAGGRPHRRLSMRPGPGRRRALCHGGAALAACVCSTKSTGVPRRTIPASFIASQLVSRTQPCDWVLLVAAGVGGPWVAVEGPGRA